MSGTWLGRESNIGNGLEVRGRGQYPGGRDSHRGREGAGGRRWLPQGLPPGSGLHLQSDGKPHPCLLIYKSLSGGAEARVRLLVLLPVSLGVRPVLESRVPGLGALPGSLRKRATQADLRMCSLSALDSRSWASSWSQGTGQSPSQAANWTRWGRERQRVSLQSDGGAQPLCWSLGTLGRDQPLPPALGKLPA